MLINFSCFCAVDAAQMSLLVLLLLLLLQLPAHSPQRMRSDCHIVVVFTFWIGCRKR
jgi:hypothetical protein